MILTLSVRCPVCFAEPNEPCHGSSHDFSHTFPMPRGHKERQEAARSNRKWEVELA